MKLYHGSKTPIKRFDVKAGKGRFGNGLYLTPNLDTAKFYASGGRQGNSGQILSDVGYIYEFNVEGNIYVVRDLYDFLRDHVMDLETAEQTFENSGDIDHIEKHVAEWADREGYDGVDFSKISGGVLDPLPQILIINKKAIKSARLLKSPERVEAKEDTDLVSLSEIKKMIEEFKQVFTGYNVPTPPIKFMRKKGVLGHTSFSARFNGVDVETTVTLELINGIQTDREMCRKIVAHEMIHVWEFYFSDSALLLRDAKTSEDFRRYSKELASIKHGKDFTYWMDKFNAKYGDNFVTIEGRFDIPDEHIKPYYLIVRPSPTGTDYLYAVAFKLTERAKHYIKQYVEKYDAKVFKVQKDYFRSTKKTISDNIFYRPLPTEQIKYVKDLYEKEVPIVISTLDCDEESLKNFAEDFALQFRPRVTTLQRILHNYEKDYEDVAIYKPFLIEIRKQVIKNFGNCDAIKQQKFELVFPIQSAFKPKSQQFQEAMHNWFGFLRSIIDVLHKKYLWLNKTSLLNAVSEMESNLKALEKS